MLANLSIVLDTDKQIRLDILKNIPISQIDEYTTAKTSSKEIREEYKEEITSFLETHKELTDTFKKEANKKGSLVIIYSDENNKLHRMRVLYQDNKKKTNTQSLLKRIFDVIRDMKDPAFTIELIRYFDFFLGSDFNYKEVKRIEKNPSTNIDICKRQNQRLINLIRNKIRYSLENNYERGYFYLRLIDSYLEKNGFETTTRDIKTNKGTIKISEKNIKKPTKITKEQPYKKVIEEKEEPQHETESSFYTDENGQYSFIKEEPVKTTQKVYMSYEDYLDYLDEQREKRR